jgi:hypothetical protein
MSAKLTFEAKMDGMEKVLDLLKAAEQRMGDMGRVGSQSLEGVDRRVKDFTASLEHITKAQSGMGGLFKSFDELNKKSNEFLGKSYKGVVDALKFEVKGFEQEADRILSKIREADKELAQFKSRKASMSEQEYQQGIASRQTEMGRYQAESVAVRMQQHELQNQVRTAQPLNESFFNMMSARGLGQYATVGAAAAYGPGIVSALLSAPAMLASGAEVAGGALVRSNYTKEVDSYLATRRLTMQQAQAAQQGNVTTSMLKQLGIGLENTVPNSFGGQLMEGGQYYGQTAGVQGLKGAGVGLGVGAGVVAGVGAASLLGAGGLAAVGSAGIGGTMLAGLGLMGPIGWAALGAGALGYGAYSYMSAKGNEKTREQIRAENALGYRGKDSEAYGIVFDKAGQNFMRESGELGTAQRMYGVDSTHEMSMTLARQGQGMDRANPVINMLMAQGMNPNAFLGGGDMASFITRNNRYGITSAQQTAIARAQALNGGSLVGQQNAALGMFAGAGLTSAGDMVARGNLGDYAAGLASQRGAGQDMGTVGAPLAAAVAANGAGFNAVEGVGQGIANYEAQSRLMQGGSSGLDMIMVSKLRQMGVTNAVAIDTFIKMDLRNPKTQQAIANYAGKSLSEIQKMLGEGADVYKGMFESVIGKDEMNRINKATGGDVTTLMTTGLKAFDNTTAGGGTFMDTLKSSISGGGMGDPNAVALGAETTADKQNYGQAENQVAVDEQMRKALEGTGKTVTDAITQAVVKGFLDVADEVRKAGDRIQADKSTATPIGSDRDSFNSRKGNSPYTGTKGR